MEKRKVGRPRLGENVRIVAGVRLDPVLKAGIIKRYGSVQRWLDEKVVGMSICETCGGVIEHESEYTHKCPKD